MRHGCAASALHTPRRRYFWIDIAALLPLDFLVLCMATRADGVSATAIGYFQLTRLLRLVHFSSSTVCLLCQPTPRTQKSNAAMPLAMHWYVIPAQLMTLIGVGPLQLRMYRVPQFFLHLEYKLTVSLLAVTLVRNFVVWCFGDVPSCSGHVLAASALSIAWADAAEHDEGDCIGDQLWGLDPY